MGNKEKPTRKPDTGAWANIIKASVKGNPKPKKSVKNDSNVSEIIDTIEAEIKNVAGDDRKYLLYQVGNNTLNYSFNYSCPKEAANKMEAVLKDIASRYTLSITVGRMAE